MIMVYSLIGVFIVNLDVNNIMNIICVFELIFCFRTSDMCRKLGCFYGILVMFP